MQYVLLILSICACSASPPPLSDAAAIPGDGAGVDGAAGKTGYRAIFARYGTIETIAGIGAIEGKGINGWNRSFEGKPGTSVELSRPHMAQSDAAGNVYIADKDGQAIRRIDVGGNISTFAGTSRAGDDGDGPLSAESMRLSSPNGLWVSGSGTVYILDLGNDKVRRVRDGLMDTLFVIRGAGPGRGLWVSQDESLAYVSAGSSLKQWTPSAGVTVLSSGFVSLGNLSVESTGDILVSDRGGSRVYRVRPSGAKIVVAGTGQQSGGGDGEAALATGLDQVRGVWAHPDGGYWLATHKGGQVWYVDVEGIIHLFVDGANGLHAGDGLAYNDPSVRISEPRSVTMDAAGNVLITENDGGYIRRVNLVP